MFSLTRVITSLVIASALLVGATAGFAKGGNDGVQRSGNCTGAGNWKLKAKPDDGRLETEFEVDQNRSGVTWKYRIRRNGRTVAKGRRVTMPPSGSFSVERRIADPVGTDRITAVATRAGETCRASLSI